MTIDWDDLDSAADFGGEQPVMFVPTEKQVVRCAKNLYESSGATKYLAGPNAAALVAIAVVNRFAIRGFRD